MTKLNPVLASLGKEVFPDTDKQLFGDGFEARLKLRSEAANTVADGKKVGKTFFRDTAPPEDSKGAFGVAEDNTEPLTEGSLTQHQAIRPQAHHSAAEAIPAKTTAVTLVRPNHLPPGMFRNLLHSSTRMPQAGRLKHFLPAWEQITKHPWILQVVSGYQIEFLDYPVQHRTPAPIPCIQDNQTIIHQDFQELL